MSKRILLSLMLLVCGESRSECIPWLALDGSTELLGECSNGFDTSRRLVYMERKNNIVDVFLNEKKIKTCKLDSKGGLFCIPVK